MNFIEIAICVNNVDPKGIGRIRCIWYNDYISQKEKALNYNDWDDKDSFVAQPFLPNNINFIPNIGQAVKVLTYTSTNSIVNQEYISGPFTTMYDYDAQTYTQQLENTTYGVIVKHKQDIREKNGNYILSKTENAFARDKDFGVYGKYGSDIILTENGLQLRGGKLLSKENLSPSQKEKLVSFPLMSEKVATLYLKKFPQKATLVNKRIVETKSDNLDLKAIIEYEVDDLTSPTLLSFYVYKVINPYGPTFKTNFFNESTTIDANSVKLINTDNTPNTPTFTIIVNSVDAIPRIIRDKLYTIHDENLSKINNLLPDEDLHPFFFRPTQSFKRLVGDKTDIYEKIKLSNAGPGPGSGLVWSKLRLRPQVREIVKEQKILKIVPGSVEQTFAGLKSDKIYFLSTDTNEGNPPCVNCGNSINFNELDKYELTQQDYIEKIEPNTYATVRGENLLRFLKQIVQVIYTHAHNINKPINEQPDYVDGQILLDMLKTLETDLLNKSIRVN
jgi:hypothetical protein